MSYPGITMPGDGSRPPGNANADDDDDQQGTATQQAAYVAPTDGQPTICQNCMHFDGQGACDHPQVIADPEVQGKVEANGHSKFFYAKSAEEAEGEMGVGKKLPKPDAAASGLAAGARFPKAASSTFQGD